MKRKGFLIGLSAMLMLLSGCAAIFQPKTLVPIETKIFGNTTNPSRICILLPGIRDRLGEFEKHGFIEIAQPLLEKRPDTAVIAVDAHWGYYRERIVIERLTQDIIKKYPDAKFTFVGASLGGFGSLLMAMEHTENIENLVLLAPLLGEDDYEYLQRIKEQGLVNLPNDEDLTLSLNRAWKFILDPQRKFNILLGYGHEDSFAPYYDHLRSLKPPRLTMEAIKGDHDWETWRSLWQRYAQKVI